MFEPFSCGEAVDCDIFESVGNPCVHDGRRLELTSHLLRDFTAGDSVFDPEFPDPGIRVRERQV